MQIRKEKTRQEVGRHIKRFFFFAQQNSAKLLRQLRLRFRLIKIEELLSTYFVTFHSLWSTKSAGFDRSI